MAEIAIDGEMIRLGQPLKLAGVIDSGAEVKGFLATEPVWVNGEPEQRRGRQIHPGDVVRTGSARTACGAQGSVNAGAATLQSCRASNMSPRSKAAVAAPGAHREL